MKKMSWFRNPVSIATMLICGLFLLITAMKCNSSSPEVGSEASASFNRNSKSLTKTIKLDKYERILKGLEQGQLVLQLYPVKHSASADKQDFDLEILPCDEKGKPLGPYAGKELAESDAYHFLAYAKGIDVPVSLVSPGYQLVLDRNKLKAGSSLTLRLSFNSSLTNMAFISGGQTTKSADSVPICKCPPGCPQLTGSNCIYLTEMSAVVNKVYTLPK